LKQLEKQLPTAKGISTLYLFHLLPPSLQLTTQPNAFPALPTIVSQSVKDVLQSLVDDDMVSTDKIGIQNFYWSFPSQVQISVRR
jgi:hypothetical protein